MARRHTLEPVIAKAWPRQKLLNNGATMIEVANDRPVAETKW